jgi:xylan 1,4-beta-xylosidase
VAQGAAANPVLPGDHPDPTLLRTGAGWYMASTSNDWLPAFPILHSPDLAHWREVGSVLPRRPRWAARDFWAPDFVRRDGRVLVYYAAQTRSRRRCVAVASAPRVLGPYRDHGPIICTRIGEIDPVPVTDEHGADWLLWKRNGNAHGQHTPILAAPLAPGGMSLSAPPRELFRADQPWERGLVEGPALLRHGGTFYLLYSAGRCCGEPCDYVTGVARAPSLLGPWEKRPGPILRGNGTFRCPGHVSVGHDAHDELVLAYHAYVRGNAADRQLLVAPLRFDAAGWPRVGPSRTAPAEPATARFDFVAPLGIGWEWPVVGWRPYARVAGARLVLGRGTLARQTGATRFTATTTVAARRDGARPGIAVMGGFDSGVGIELRGPRAVVWRVTPGSRREIAAVRLRGRRAELRLTVGRRVSLAVRPRPRIRWIRVARGQPPPSWIGGAHVALTVGGSRRARAEFESLLIVPRGTAGR